MVKVETLESSLTKGETLTDAFVENLKSVALKLEKLYHDSISYNNQLEFSMSSVTTFVSRMRVTLKKLHRTQPAAFLKRDIDIIRKEVKDYSLRIKGAFKLIHSGTLNAFKIARQGQRLLRHDPSAGTDRIVDAATQFIPIL